MTNVFELRFESEIKSVNNNVNIYVSMKFVTFSSGFKHEVNLSF